MSDNEPTKRQAPDPAFSDEDARAILRRATEIEREGRVTADGLREIAKEAQISPDAINRALAEAQAGREVAEPTSAPAPAVPDDGAQMSNKGWALVFMVVAFAVAMMMML